MRGGDRGGGKRWGGVGKEYIYLRTGWAGLGFIEYVEMGVGDGGWAGWKCEVGWG